MPMQVILLERVAKLGQMGDVVKVKPGFARNFLLPQKKALRATKENIAYFETQRKRLEAVNLERRKDAEQVATKLKDFSVTLIRQASESLQLYGSVTARDIADAINQAGVTVNRQQVVLEQGIKSLGVHKVEIALHPEVSVKISANVARSPEEAEFQAKGGVLVAATDRAAQEANLAEQQMAAQAAELLEKPVVEADAAAPAEAPAESEGEAKPKGKAKAKKDAAAEAEAEDAPKKKKSKKSA